MERSCKNCQQRRVGCHANCERYKADCAQDAKRRAYEKQFAYMDNRHRLKKDPCTPAGGRPTVKQKGWNQ